MLSAQKFKGTDLQVEIVATPLPDWAFKIPILKNVLDCDPTNCWIAPSYVRLDGKEYHLDDLINTVKILKGNEYNSDKTAREFRAEIKIKVNMLKETHIKLSCVAPVT